MFQLFTVQIYIFIIRFLLRLSWKTCPNRVSEIPQSELFSCVPEGAVVVVVVFVIVFFACMSSTVLTDKFTVVFIVCVTR